MQNAGDRPHGDVARACLRPRRAWLVACLPDPAMAQAGAMPLAQETLEIGDEPGRISTEEAVISEGPYARQIVFFRSSEPAGTLVVHTAERFVYLVQGNNRALRYGIGVGREGVQWSDWCGSAARPSGRTGARRRR